LGYGCADGGLVFSINAHMWGGELPLLEHGSDEQKQRWLPGLCSGELIGCQAITEPDSGSDAFALKCTARPAEGGYVLSGQKTFATNAPVADVIVAFARDGEGIGRIGRYGITALLVEKGSKGCT